MARFAPLAARPGKQRVSAVLFAFQLFSLHSAARKLLAPARTSTLKSRQHLKAKPKRREGQNPSRRFGADGEICAFGGAPRKTAGVRCFVCVPTLLSPFCRTQTARSRSHLHPQISPAFKGKTKAAGRTKSFPPLWRGWRDLNYQVPILFVLNSAV